MLYCVTDIGSNTVKMNIFDRSDDGGMNLVYAVSSTLGLAGHRSDGALTDRGVELLTALLLKYRKDAEAHGCDAPCLCDREPAQHQQYRSSVRTYTPQDRNVYRCSVG